jgi:hypothetical protein
MRFLAFLDLDLTLFDYSSAREGATCAALQAMGFGNNLTDALIVMDQTLVPHGDLLVELGFPNFRREWKAPELFAFLSLVCKRRDLLLSVMKLSPSLDSIGGKNHRMSLAVPGFWNRKHNRDLLHNVLEKDVLYEIKKQMDQILQDPGYKERISTAVAAFEAYLKEYVMLSEGVDHLLEVLLTHSFETYIVSEGDDRIQKDKVSVLGLAKSVDGIYVSSVCGQSERLLDWLWKKSMVFFEDETQELINAVAIIYDEVLQYSNKTATLFRKVLHTILLPQHARNGFYTRFGWLNQKEWQAQVPVYILLFGDRYDKDLYPGFEAFKNVVTIRLLSGKYRQEYSSATIAKTGLPKPTLTVESVSEAAEFIESDFDHSMLVPSEGLAPISDAERINRFGRALILLRNSSGDLPSWVAEQLEALNIALRGSEVSTHG